jgi:hypothetical protein
VTIDRSVIRVKAMLIATNTGRTAHAVSLNGPTIENPAGYHRLIGGTVELGESHRDTIRREVDEELGATIRDLTLLTTVENIFTLDGDLGHGDRLPLLRTTRPCTAGCRCAHRERWNHRSGGVALGQR